jgi:hypothetical protein
MNENARNNGLIVVGIERRVVEGDAATVLVDEPGNADLLVVGSERSP